MNLAVLKSYMQKMSPNSLKQILGNEVLDTIIEWTETGEPLFPKNKLVELILLIHGIKFLKKKENRRKLLRTFNCEDVQLLGQTLNNTVSYKSEIDIVNELVNIPWGKNDVSKKIINILNLEETILKPSVDKQKSFAEFIAYDRFYELLDYQFTIKQRVLTILETGSELSSMLIHMPTGTGKTKTSMHILCHHYCFNLKTKGTIIWLAHTKELLEQAYVTFKDVWKHLGHGTINAYKLWGSNELPTSFNGNGVVFCGIQKMMSIFNTKRELFDEINKDVRLIFFDEAHKAGAQQTKNIVKNLMIKKPYMSNRNLIGLSATPGRSTECSFDNTILSELFDNRIISIDVNVMNSINYSKIEAINKDAENNIISYFQNRRVLAKVKKQLITYDYNYSAIELIDIRTVANIHGYDDFTEKALNIIASNKSRNMRILQELRKLYNNNTPTIVFACSAKHGKLLSAMLNIEEIPNSCVMGDMSPEERDASISAFKDRDNHVNIIINYQVLTTGFDSTNIRCVFITRPTQSVVLYSQMLGRGLRGPKMGGNEECLLIDVKDNLDNFDEKMAFSHFNNYWN